MPSAKYQKNFWRFGLLIIAALYFAARLLHLADSCLVFDEIFSVHAATHSWSSLFQFVAVDLIHPPLFYVLLKFWILAGGESLLWLRIYPVFFAVLAIAPFLLLCLELKLKKAEILTAFFFLATNGALIRYSQEVRMYTVLFCLSIVSLWLFVKFLDRKFTVVIYLALLFFNLLLIYTHYFGWLLIGGETVTVLVLRREKSRQFFALVGVLAAGFLPWVWTIWSVSPLASGLAQNIGWQSKPDLVKLTEFLLTLNEPFYYQQSNVDPISIWLISVPLALVCLGSIATVAFYKQIDEKMILLLILVSVPLILAFIASWLLPYSIWGVRHLIIIFAPFALLASISINRLPFRNLKFALYGLIMVLSLIAGLMQFTTKPRAFIWCGWETLSAQADAQTTAPTTIYVFEDDGAYQLWYALKNNPKFKVVSIKGYDDLPEDKSFFLPRRFDDVQIADKTAITGDKFYLAFRETSWKPDKQVLHDLTAQGYKIGEPLEFTAQGVTAFLIPVSDTEN